MTSWGGTSTTCSRMSTSCMCWTNGMIRCRPGSMVSLYLPSCSTMPCWYGRTMRTLEPTTTSSSRIRITMTIGDRRRSRGLLLVRSAGTGRGPSCLVAEGRRSASGVDAPTRVPRTSVTTRIAMPGTSACAVERTRPATPRGRCAPGPVSSAAMCSSTTPWRRSAGWAPMPSSARRLVQAARERPQRQEEPERGDEEHQRPAPGRSRRGSRRAAATTGAEAEGQQDQARRDDLAAPTARRPGLRTPRRVFLTSTASPYRPERRP